MLKRLKEFFSDESGQTTTEYFLILAVVVTIFMQFRKKLIGVITKLGTQMDKGVNVALSDFDDGGSGGGGSND